MTAGVQPLYPLRPVRPAEDRVRVLIVEDEALIALDLKRRLQAAGYEVVGVVDNYVDALGSASESPPELILMDISIRGGVDGIDTARAIRQVADIPIVFLTAFVDDATLQRASDVSPYGYLLKPFDASTLVATLLTALRRHRVDREHRVMARAFASATVAIQLIDITVGHPTVVFVNDAFSTLTGARPDEVLGKPPLLTPAVHDDAAVARVSGAIKDAVAIHDLLHLARADGTTFWSSVAVSPVTDVAGNVTHVLVFQNDATRERLAQDAWAQSQRKSVLGHLASSIAHEFANVMLVVESHARAARDVVVNEQVRADLDAIIESTLAGGRIAARLQQMTALGPSESSPSTDLVGTLRRARRLVSAMAGARVEVGWDVPLRPIFVSLSSREVEQIILDLVVNAREAMPGGGTLTISVTQHSVPDDGGSPRKTVRLAVQDSVDGMDARQRARATLPRGTAPGVATTGLGLSTSSMLAQRAGGTLDLVSSPGAGTTVILELPEAEPFESAPTAAEPAPETAVPPGTGCLVVAAGHALRIALTRALGSVGFRVEAAGGLGAARRAVAGWETTPALAIVDAGAGSVSGTDIDSLCAGWTPKPHVIVLSGQSDDDVSTLGPDVAVLWKPFSLTSLLRRAADVVTGERYAAARATAPARRDASGERPAASDARHPEYRVLLVCSDRDFNARLEAVLRASATTLLTAESGDEALRAQLICPLDAVIVDLTASGAADAEWLRTIRTRDPLIQLLAIADDPGPDAYKIALEARSRGLLRKSAPDDELTEQVAELVRASQFERLQRRILLGWAGTDQLVRDTVATEKKFQQSLRTVRSAFQPIVRAHDGIVVGYEALMRSQGPFSNPRELLASAEVLGRLNELELAMRTAIASRLEETPHDDDLLFVNLHPHEFAMNVMLRPDEPLLPHARRVVIEVTERAQLGDDEDVVAKVAALRDAGYRVALDDLGHGYAGLTWLVRLGPDIAKIDMSLVRDIHQSRVKRELVSSLVTVCRRSGTFTVAEGVEHAHQAEILRDLGCDLLQGYYFGRPDSRFLTDGHLAVPR